MSQGKKPTMMEVKTAINNMIIELSNVQRAITAISSTFDAYVDFNDNRDKFKNWLEIKLKEMKDDQERRGGNNSNKDGSPPLINREDRGSTRGTTSSVSKDKVIGIKRTESSK